jgi:hypothetical protein
MRLARNATEKDDGEGAGSADHRGWRSGGSGGSGGVGVDGRSGRSGSTRVGCRRGRRSRSAGVGRKGGRDHDASIC